MVYRPRDYLTEVADERDGVEESPEENQVACNAVDESKNSIKHFRKPFHAIRPGASSKTIFLYFALVINITFYRFYQYKRVKCIGLPLEKAK